MAKYVHSYSTKGELDAGSLEIQEQTKETIETHDLGEVLKQFHGKVVSITIKEEIVAEPSEAQYS